MKKRSSDEEFDNILRAIIADSGACDEDVKAVADSPATWWGVQRQIAAATPTHRPWPPSTLLRRLMTFAVPAAAIAGLLLAALLLTDAPRVERDVASVPRSEEPYRTDEKATVSRADPPKAEENSLSPRRTDGRAASNRMRRSSRSGPTSPKTVAAGDEIRSDFIAVSYGDAPDSGQVVRVKVPRSMMVSLGLVAAVERPTALIEAEVVVGDDGRTHAIRFIH